MADQEKTTLFAETNFRNQRTRFGIKRKDRTKHTYIIGKTGMGKTTLLENMAIQDIQSGEGIGIIDPHGEFAEKMLDFVPKERINDVVYFNPADLDYPIGFNPLQQVSTDQRHVVSSGLLGVFKKIFGVEVFSARMEYFLANSIFAHLELPDSTLLGVNRIFGDKEYRKKIVSGIQDPIVRSFWENEFAKMPEQFMREAVAAIQNKVGQFSGNPLIRNIVGQTDTAMDLREIMDKKKILIMNLSKGKVGEENSRLLGAMLVTKIYLTAMSRVDIKKEEDRPDFYLYVDEFQNFATDSFASILSEARKYRLNLTLAHQYMAQMDEMVQDAVIGNVGTMITFRVGGDDAEILEKEFGPEFMTSDLVNLGFAQIYLKLMIDGIASRPFSAETLPPFPKPEESHKDEIVEVSRKRYGTPKKTVEEKIRKWSGFFTESEKADAIAKGEWVEPVKESSFAKASEDEGGRASRRPQRKLYEAKCAVDGETVMVPFEPDPRRPVYCEKHLEAIRSGELKMPTRREMQRKDMGQRERIFEPRNESGYRRQESRNYGEPRDYGVNRRQEREVAERKSRENRFQSEETKRPPMRQDVNPPAPSRGIEPRKKDLETSFIPMTRSQNIREDGGVKNNEPHGFGSRAAVELNRTPFQPRAYERGVGIETKSVVRTDNAEKPISLSALKPRAGEKREDNEKKELEKNKPEDHVRKGPNLEELRKILQESLADGKRIVPKSENRGQEFKNSGTLKPGDSIKF